MRDGWMRWRMGGWRMIGKNRVVGRKWVKKVGGGWKMGEGGG